MILIVPYIHNYRVGKLQVQTSKAELRPPFKESWAVNTGGSTPRVQGLGFRVLGFRFEV